MYQPEGLLSLGLCGIVIAVEDHKHCDGFLPSSKLPHSYPFLLNVPAQHLDMAGDLNIPALLAREVRDWITHCQSYEDDYLEFACRLGLSRDELLKEDYINVGEGYLEQRAFWRSSTCARLLDLFGSWRCRVCAQVLQRFNPTSGNGNLQEYRCLLTNLMATRTNRIIQRRWLSKPQTYPSKLMSPIPAGNGTKSGSSIHIPLIIQAAELVLASKEQLSAASNPEPTPSPESITVSDSEKVNHVHKYCYVRNPTPTYSKTTSESTISLEDPTFLHKSTPTPELPPVPQYLHIPSSELRTPPQPRRHRKSTSKRVQKSRSTSGTCGPVTRSRKAGGRASHIETQTAREGGPAYFTRSQARAKR